MNIVIVGGGKKMDFLVASLLEKKHRVTIINENIQECRRLANEHNAQVIIGDGSEVFILEDAGIRNADLMIAITSRDADNLVICQLAKKRFHVKRAFATVNNPKNVAVFKRLGINTAVSATYMLANIIEQMAAVHDIISYFPMEAEVQIIEIGITDEHKACGKKLADVGFPKNSIVGCIIRGGKAFVPGANTEIKQEDKLVILTNEDSRNAVINVLVGGHAK